MVLSILVPVYNAERYLNRCIDSILAQTFKDFELILLNDGSTDRSGEICEAYSKSDERVSVINSENRGVAAARNTLLQHAKGQYVGFVDSDDAIEPTMYEILYNNMISARADISLCGTRFVFPKKTITNCPRREKKVLKKEEAVSELIDNWRINCSPWGKLYKLTLFKDVAYPNVKAFEDMMTTYRIFAKCDRIIYDSTPLYNYFNTPDSLIRSKFGFYHLSEIEAQQKMTADVGKAYPALKGKLKMKELTAKLYICNRIISESPEHWTVYQTLSKEIKSHYLTIMRSRHAAVKMKIMVTIMKISDKIYRLLLNAVKNRGKA